jgi:hypothetical protein
MNSRNIFINDLAIKALVHTHVKSVQSRKRSVTTGRGSIHDAGAPYANQTQRRPAGDEHAPTASSRRSAAHRRGERRTPAPCGSVVAVQARRPPVARFPRRAQSPFAAVVELPPPPDVDR